MCPHCTLYNLSFAAIPIESRGLSQGAQSNNISTQSAIATGADAPQTNTSWQLMQKNQQLENDLRSLRGKIEEQENEIERLKSELTNRYADLDQRLELLQQKLNLLKIPPRRITNRIFLPV